MTITGPQDPWYQVAEIVRLIRTGGPQTRPEMADATRLGRNVVSERLQTAFDLGLIKPTGTKRSRGGRAAEIWTFSADTGQILVGQVGVSALRVGLTTLDGTMLDAHTIAWSLPEHPAEETCHRLAEAMAGLLLQHNLDRPWGITIGMPAPVDPVTGHNLDPIASTATVPRWPREFDTRRWFSDRFKTPVWTESSANLAALGAATQAGAAADLVFVRVGTGIGAGIISRGQLHRGATALAGTISHVLVREDPERPCHCGRTGCLDTYAAGWALLKEATATADSSTYLSELVRSRELTLDDLVDGAERGDPGCVDILVRAAEALGRALGPVITCLNPGELIVGGHRLVHDPLFRTVLDRAIRSTALNASLQQLTIRPGDPAEVEVFDGAAETATAALLSPGFLADWGPTGSPQNAASLVTRDQQI